MFGIFQQMGGEMMYILEQRLVAQHVVEEKSKKGAFLLSLSPPRI
jgi:hypothetical protein